MTYLIDSHCHLTYDVLASQIGDVIARANSQSVKEFVTIATDLADAERALKLSAAHPSIHVVSGIHPHEAGKVASLWDEALYVIAQRDDVFAVGEMGLDYHYDFSDRAMQHSVFRRQLDIAAQVQKPVVIHCREAHADTLAALKEFPAVRRVVFHCFTGTVNEAREILDRGYWISLTGVVTFKRSDELREVAKLLPDDRFMVETDSPYLSPEPVRSTRPNEPSFLIHTARKLAEVRGMSLADFSNLATSNTRNFFGLPNA